MNDNTIPDRRIHVPGIERTRYGFIPVVYRPGIASYPAARFHRKTKTTEADALRYAAGVAHRRQTRATHLRPLIDRAS